MSHVDTIACFIELPEMYHSLFAITDLSFNPIYTLETAAYINSCSISDDGNYAIFQTAFSPISPDDSEMIWFINVNEEKVLWKKDWPSDWRSVTSLFIDTHIRKIFEEHDRDHFHCEYDFNGNKL